MYLRSGSGVDSSVLVGDMYRIKVLSSKGKTVEVPQRTFKSTEEIEEYMDKYHPLRIYISDFAHKRDKQFNLIESK